MDMVSSWEEFKRFFGAVKPLDVRVYGRLPAEARAWVSQFGDIVSRKFEHHTAGFAAEHADAILRSIRLTR